MNLQPEVIIAIISAVTAVTATFVTAFIAWRKWPTEQRIAQIDAATKITTSAAAFVDDLAARIAVMTDQVDKLEKENRERGADLACLRVDLVQALERIRKLTQRVKELERENTELHNCIDDLERENTKLLTSKTDAQETAS